MSMLLLGVRIHYGLFPTIFLFMAGIFIYKYYDLIGEKKEAMIKKLKDMGLFR